MAFGTKQQEGTQRSEAMKAFGAKGGGVDVSTGMLKRSDHLMQQKPGPRGKPAPSGEGGGPTQRELAMRALQGNIAAGEQAK